MKKICLLFVLISGLPVLGRAQEVSMRVSPTNEVKPKFDKKFWLVAGVTALAVVFDTETTIRNMQPGVRESNPVARPFAGSRAGLYGYKIGFGTGIVLSTHWIRKNPTAPKKLWLILLGGTATAHFLAGMHNQHIR